MFEARRAVDIAGVAACKVFGFGGNQGWHAKRTRNWCRHKTVGRRDDRTKIACGKMLLYDCECLIGHGWANHPLHVFFVPSS